MNYFKGITAGKIVKNNLFGLQVYLRIKIFRKYKTVELL